MRNSWVLYSMFLILYASRQLHIVHYSWFEVMWPVIVDLIALLIWSFVTEIKMSKRRK